MTAVGAVRSFLSAITRNGVSLAGAALTTAAALLFFSLFAIESLGFERGPYLGIITFMVVPAMLVLGLVLIPVGIARERRRHRLAAERGVPPPRLPVLDLNLDRTRTMLLVFVAASVVNFVILALATYKSVEVMETTKFCGTACHSVMHPEYTAYQRSPHARVPCVDCHIGSGAGWFVKSKLTGSWQLISVNLDLYPKPIPAPVHDLRPARDTCEHCHTPAAFAGDRLEVLTRFQEDEPNTELKTVLLMRLGGRRGTTSSGVHWHADPSVRIRYRSDPKRETIGAVELTRPDGSVSTFTSPNAKAAGEGEWRTMDCVDCHNRASHVFRLPQREIDRAIAEGRIDRSIPFIRREGLKVLQADYGSHDEARQKIASGLAAFYAASHPSVETAKIDAAAGELGRIYASNVFPAMNVKWGAYPSHLGHTDTPGCFRCHDGEHADPSGKTIAQDCDLCHAALAVEEESPEVLKALQP